MGVGPIYAIPKALERAGMKLSDIQQIELNEAFASQSLDIPKSDYENQNKQYISNESENKYVIMD
jgi:acetyl-CoA acetyltransferase